MRERVDGRPHCIVPGLTPVRVRALRRLTPLLLAAACARAPNDRAPRDSAAAVAALPIHDTANASALRRMRARIESPPAHLAGFRSRDSLVAAFVGSVERRDSTALRALALNIGEFAYLYYPDAPLAQPPYDLDPETMWLQIGAESGRGAARTLARYGGRLGFVSYRCEPAPRVSGPVTLWNACTVTHRSASGAVTEPLFGSIIERDGWFKFVGLSNRL